jgi:glycosyltransferase involved in cell wall biosynthesis
MRTKKRKLIVVGQVPPPYHGQSVMIQSMVDGLVPHLDLVLVPMQFSREVEENGDFSIGKVFHLLTLVLRVWCLLIRYPGAMLYYPPAPPKWSTVLRDWFFLALVRPFAGKTLFHFHAYGLGEFLEGHGKRGILTWPFNGPDVALILGERCCKDAEVIRAKKTITVPYGIDIEPVKRGAEPKSTLRILFVGLHIESKGIFDLLETAGRLRNGGIEFVMHTVGPWKNRVIKDRFEQRRRALGLESCVLCFGELKGDALWAQYAAADIFFFPTFFEFETFGVVVLEAMAYGVPVVVSDWRGPGDIAIDGVTGYVCPVHDVEAYAGAIGRLAADKRLRELLGREGREHYNKRYRTSVFIGTMNAIFTEVACD